MEGRGKKDPEVETNLRLSQKQNNKKNGFHQGICAHRSVPLYSTVSGLYGLIIMIPWSSFSCVGTVLHSLTLVVARLPDLVSEAPSGEGRTRGGASGSHQSRFALGAGWEPGSAAEVVPLGDLLPLGGVARPWSGTAAETGRVGAVVT